MRFFSSFLAFFSARRSVSSRSRATLFIVWRFLARAIRPPGSFCSLSTRYRRGARCEAPAALAGPRTTGRSALPRPLHALGLLDRFVSRRRVLEHLDHGLGERVVGRAVA